MDSPKVIVVGASSGIGAAIARKLGGRGAQLALVARRETELTEVAAEIDRIAGRCLTNTYVHDVTDYDAVPALFSQIVSNLGGVDTVIYASGYGPKVDLHEYNFAKDRQIIEVNVLGAFAWLNIAAERFEKQKSGTIVGISSVAGDRGRSGMPAYNTSKAALDTYLEALRNRLARQGVYVLTIKPGFVWTDMLIGANLPPFPRPISADEAAKQILQAMDDKALVRYVPGIWRWVGMVMKNLPSPIMQRLKI
jgi:short-subunit dehydrogenase